MLVTIVRHRRERRCKCSLQPLVGRSGFRFFCYPSRRVPDVADHVRLSMDGPELTPGDAGRPLLLLDATWSRVAPMDRVYAHVEPRSLPLLKTAYPRVSRFQTDPEQGLASVEALAAAARILRADWRGVLAGYAEVERFIALNAAFFGPDRGDAITSDGDQDCPR